METSGVDGVKSTSARTHVIVWGYAMAKIRELTMLHSVIPTAETKTELQFIRMFVLRSLHGFQAA